MFEFGKRVIDVGEGLVDVVLCFSGEFCLVCLSFFVVQWVCVFDFVRGRYVWQWFEESFVVFLQVVDILECLYDFEVCVVYFVWCFERYQCLRLEVVLMVVLVELFLVCGVEKRWCIVSEFV